VRTKYNGVVDENCPRCMIQSCSQANVFVVFVNVFADLCAMVSSCSFPPVRTTVFYCSAHESGNTRHGLIDTVQKA